MMKMQSWFTMFVQSICPVRLHEKCFRCYGIRPFKSTNAESTISRCTLNSHRRTHRYIKPPFLPAFQSHSGIELNVDPSCCSLGQSWDIWLWNIAMIIPRSASSRKPLLSHRIMILAGLVKKPQNARPIIFYGNMCMRLCTTHLRYISFCAESLPLIRPWIRHPVHCHDQNRQVLS